MSQTAIELREARGKKRRAVRLALEVVVGVILCMACLPVYLFWRQKHRDQMRDIALPVTIKQAEPIVDAIQRYSKEQGSPPPSLEALTPRYLQTLPAAGPIAVNGWHYRKEEPDAGGWSLLVWVREEYSPNLFGFGDRFVFRSGGRYPTYAYGGVLVPYGKWGYYIE
jgi:hypothetical protein